MYKSSRQRINKETADLSCIIDQIDLTVTPEHSIQQQQNIHCFQINIEHFVGFHGACVRPQNKS